MLGVRLAVLLGATACVLALHGSYAGIISPQYRLEGYPYDPPSGGYLFLSALFAITPALWMPIRLERPSLCVYWILFVMAYIPICTIPWYMGTVEPFRLLLFDFWVLVTFWMVRNIYRLPLLRIPLVSVRKLGFWLMLGLLSLALYTSIISVFGLQFNFVANENVYDVRAEYTETTRESGSLSAYAVGWQSNAVNPFLISLGLLTGNVAFIGLGLAGQLMLYSITAFKSVLLSGIWLVFLLFATRKQGKLFGVWVVWGVVATILFSTFVYQRTGSPFVTSIVTRRTFVVPGILSARYFEFFSENPKSKLGDGILKNFVDYPYTQPVARVIGSRYFNANASANANLWAYGFAAFGYPGMFLFAMLLALLLWVVDSIAAGRDPRLIAMMLAIPGMTLSNTSLFTALLTHGVGLTVLLVYLLPPMNVLVRAAKRRPKRWVQLYRRPVGSLAHGTER